MNTLTAYGLLIAAYAVLLTALAVTVRHIQTGKGRG